MKNVLANRLKGAREKLQEAFAFSLAVAFSGSALAANNDVSLDTPSEGFLQKIVSWMQDLVDVVGGAGVLFVVFISLASCIIMWVIIPKAGSAALAWAFRAAMGGIALFNIALLIAWVKK